MTTKCAAMALWEGWPPQRSSGVIKQSEPQSGFDPMRLMSLFSTTSSNVDDPGRCGQLHTSLSMLRYSDFVTGIEIATWCESSRELA